MMTMAEDDGFCWRLPKMVENSSWRRELVSSTSLLLLLFVGNYLNLLMLSFFWVSGQHS